jgi:hypothetical protein
MARTLPDPSTLDWGSMSKTEFKRNELAYELADEDNAVVQRRYRTPVKREYSTQEVLAVAFAAYRINDNKYVKHLQRFSEENNPPIFPNKDLVKYHFAKGAYWVPEDFKDFEPTAEDYDAVNEALTHFKSYTFKMLANQLGQFQQDVLKAVSGDKVVSQQMGLVAYVPELIKRELKENHFKKLLRTEYHNSEHIGKEKDAVEGVFKVLSSTYSRKWESNNYVCDYMGNIVSFMKVDVLQEGASYKFKAKVKAHSRNNLFDVNETRLNYVKVGQRV